MGTVISVRDVGVEFYTSRRRKMHINTQLVERLISDLDARGVPLP